MERKQHCWCHQTLGSSTLLGWLAGAPELPLAAQSQAYRNHNRGSPLLQPPQGAQPPGVLAVQDTGAGGCTAGR